jgi:hypothetical protein
MAEYNMKHLETHTVHEVAHLEISTLQKAW